MKKRPNKLDKICTTLTILTEIQQRIVMIFWEKKEKEYSCPIDLILSTIHQLEEDWADKLNDEDDEDDLD